MGAPNFSVELWSAKSLELKSCCNPSFGFAIKGKACKNASQDWNLGVTFHAPRNLGKCDGMNLHIPKWAPALGIKVPMDSWIFREQLQRSKPIGLKSSSYHWIALGTQMSEMGSHDPFGHLKHKLWPKEGPGVKLPIWLPTTKSQELPQFHYVQVACHIPLKSSWQGLQLCFIPHFNWGFAHKVMGRQSRRSSNFGNFGTFIWESQDKMTFGCWPCGHAHIIL